ncbi:helicase HerA-like domain-containing protein [Acidiferrobacter sp.]|uniref:ATP-binding protein n=1 Tax=Acidiferrobacter sp. TaxID=1872107 RepID=UPI00261FF025|nr:helicase HerA-like domain-containing protein [Acidiferrobacter sp.]
MPSPANTVIGYVVDVQANVLTASLIEDDQGRTPTITIGDEDIPVGQIGSYVAIRQNDVNIVAIVTRMTEQEALAAPTIETPGEDTARLPFAKRIARLTPIGSISADGQFDRGVGLYPTTGAEVHAVGTTEIAKMFERFQSKGFSVGTVATHPLLTVCLDPSSLFGRHFAILGQTGSGKSWTVASLVQRTVAVMPRAHIIVLDLHGEYCWKREDGSRHYAFADAIVRHIDARELEIPYWLMTYAELCDLLIEHGEREATNQTAFFRDCLLEGRQTENSSPTSALGLPRVTVDTPIYFSLDDLMTKVRAKNIERVGNRQGPMFGDFDRFLMRIESKLNDTRYDFLLKPTKRNSSASLSSMLRDFVGLGTQKAAVTVIDLSSVPFDVRPTVAAQIGRLAFEFNYWNPRYREFPILLMCEEAHAYIPRASESQFAGARKSMERIAKEGRKYGVGLAVVSQRPHEVSETVLAQCGTFICLRITNPNDQAYVRSLVPESEGDLVSVLAGLGRGEALVLGEAVPLPTRLQFDKPNPSPNSDDVDFYANWIDGPIDLDIDAIVKRWRSQER